MFSKLLRLQVSGEFGSDSPSPKSSKPLQPKPQCLRSILWAFVQQSPFREVQEQLQESIWTTWAQATVASFCLGEAENTGEILEKPCGNAGCCTGAFTTSSCWSKQVIYNASYTAPFKILPIARTRHIACQCTKYRKILQAGPTLRTSVHMYKARNRKGMASRIRG